LQFLWFMVLFFGLSWDQSSVVIHTTSLFWYPKPSYFAIFNVRRGYWWKLPTIALSWSMHCSFRLPW
jgi:hypothetical protein